MAENEPHTNGDSGHLSSVARADSMASADSQTAQEYIQSQLQLEADAREAMPYQFDTCTRNLGPLRQVLFSCLTCRPPPKTSHEPYTPAGICYSCSISCHGEHELVELFSKRNFVCDCGTSRMPDSAPCTLRVNTETGMKGGVTGETPVEANKYNHNFQNRFCACEEAYNPHEEKGTMFQCLGLGTVEEGGCLEDWWHPECVMGWERKWYEKARRNGQPEAESKESTNAADAEAPTENGNGEVRDDPHEAEDPPAPPGFPEEEDFHHFICYKCVEANPWIKRYASAPGFLPPVYRKASENQTSGEKRDTSDEASSSLKRTAEDDEDTEAREAKRHRGEDGTDAENTAPGSAPAASTGRLCNYQALPAAPSGTFSLFLKEDFRDHICHCPDCFPRLKPFPQLLEDEEAYEPPLSEDGDGQGGQSVGTGSLLDRGEAALSNVDRVRAIEGVMVYNHLKDRVKSFLQPFAESGQAVRADDIKAYFEKLRGDAEGIKWAASGAKVQGEDGEGGGDSRREQSGY